MLLLKDIKGQNNPVRYLSRSLDLGRISSSYLFSGPRGVGRALTARAFLAELLFPDKAQHAPDTAHEAETEKISRNEHPDVKWIVPEKNKNVGISEIREIKDFLYMKPFSSGRNAAVIEDAHMMTLEAANALLKVLEEPPGSSLVILISDNKEMIPETVLSRCSEVRFSGLPSSQAAEIIMKESGVDRETAETLARLSQGSVGRAIESMKSGYAERRGDVKGMLKDITCRRRDVLMNWYSDEKDTLIGDIDTVVAMLRDAVLEAEGFLIPLLDETARGEKGDWAVSKRDEGETYSSMERLLELKKALSGNVNAKIAAQILPSFIGG